VLAALLAAAVGGCAPPAAGPADTFGIDFAGTNPSGGRSAVVFFIDGLNADVFDAMLRAGELPNFRRHFVERGLYCRRAVAGLPSVTLADETTFVTGLLPGHHGITGINWFDRNRLIWRNYETIAQKNTLDDDYNAPTIYEQFPYRTTFSLFFQAHRGATKFVENWTSAGPPYLFGFYEYIDRLSLFRFHILTDVARVRREFPAVTICYLLAPDQRSYQQGPDSEAYRESIRQADRQIGRVLGDMRRGGVYDDLVIGLVSDHGHTGVERHFSLEDFLANVGLDIAPAHLWENTKFEDRLSYYRRYSCVLYGSGDRYWAICLRKPLPQQDATPASWAAWPVRPDANDLRHYPTTKTTGGIFERRVVHGTVDLIDALAAQEAVDVVTYAAGTNRVRVRRRTGEVEFAQPAGPGGAISCRVLDGNDPLGYRGKVPADVLAGRPLGQRQWLEATKDAAYPDLPAQILAYFRSRRAGDIAVFAAAGWDFGNVHRGGHGGLSPADMFTPLLLAGPGVPHATLPVARTADTMPTLLRLLGRPAPPGLDGQSLVDPARKQ